MKTKSKPREAKISESEVLGILAVIRPVEGNPNASSVWAQAVNAFARAFHGADVRRAQEKLNKFNERARLIP